MIIPTVGVVVGDDNRGALPLGRLFQKVDHVDDIGLFVQRIGITGVAVLNRDGFQEADCGHVAGRDGRGEILDIIFVIGGVSCLSDGGGGSWAHVSWVGSRRVI